MEKFFGLANKNLEHQNICYFAEQTWLPAIDNNIRLWLDNPGLGDLDIQLMRVKLLEPHVDAERYIPLFLFGVNLAYVREYDIQYPRRYMRVVFPNTDIYIMSSEGVKEYLDDIKKQSAVDGIVGVIWLLTNEGASVVPMTMAKAG